MPTQKRKRTQIKEPNRKKGRIAENNPTFMSCKKILKMAARSPTREKMERTSAKRD